jgi:hypothetical protein
VVNVENSIFWDVTDISEERIIPMIRVTGIIELKYYVVFLSSMLQLLVAANIVPSSPILVTLMMMMMMMMMMGAICTSERSVLTRITWRNIPEDGILYRRS